MTPRDRVLNAFLGKSVDRVPATCVNQTGTVEFMEATGAKWPEAHRDPELMVKLAMAAYELAGLETARIPYGLTVLAEALGAGDEMGTIDRQPSVKLSPSSPGLGDFQIPDNLLELKRVAVVLKATKMLKEKVGDKLPVMVGLEGPTTLAGHLVGVERLAIWFRRKPEEVKKALEVAAEANIIYVKALVDAGADVIVVNDPTASPDILSPKDFDATIKPYLAKVAEAIKAVKVLHICGRATPILKSMAEAGYDVISIEEKVNMREAKQIVGDMARVIGNISPAKTLLMGTPQQVKEESIQAIKDGTDALAPGCGLAPRTPTANLRAMVEAAIEAGYRG
ncbi:MAG: methylcobamide--CoM methyltransferase [Candidatus Methanomethylicota archaeon]|uniref:Methylcobamide--CoM methyltransferase n=1 Tax=Thermoproteota archaeon TaxID=2056631 RepID=A0A497F2F8_9CREN|nr:MAG: methylcobamide--CoM methyltransferase [Candidatus Verstraetearchaeota archaeon]